MKIIVLICALVYAQAEINFSSVQERKLTVDTTREPRAAALCRLFSKTNHETYIVGGEEATPHQYPHQVGLVIETNDGRYAFCGAVCISQNFVLTAAHCLDGAIRVLVIFGAHRITESEDTQILMVSTNFTIHENWNPTLVKNDIAVITLPEPVPLNEYVNIIELPPESERNDFSGAVAYVCGWGLVNDTAAGISPVLRCASAKIFSKRQCSMFYAPTVLIDECHICMDGCDLKSACRGDSGGPLMIKVGEKVQLIGLVSFGDGSGCEKGYPAVFTRISCYYDWINSQLN